MVYLLFTDLSSSRAAKVRHTPVELPHAVSSARRVTRKNVRLDAAVLELESRILFAGTHPLTAVPVLNSLTGTFAKLYLDFNGDATNHNTPAFDTDGDPTNFSDGEFT